MKTTKKPEDREYFTKIPDSVGEAEWMNGSLLYVYYAVAKHRNYKNPQEPAFPSQARIARITKLSLSQVRRLLKVLEKQGVFTRTPGRGQGHSTRYRFQQEKGSWMNPFPEEAEAKGVMGDHLEGVMGDHLEGVMGDHLEGVMGDPLSRTSKQDPLNETYRVTKCSHPDTARCSKCLTATVVSRPVSPASPKSQAVSTPVGPPSPESESEYF